MKIGVVVFAVFALGVSVNCDPDAEAKAEADPQNIIAFSGGFPSSQGGQQRSPQIDPSFYQYILPIMINNLVWGLENAALQGKFLKAFFTP